MDTVLKTKSTIHNGDEYNENSDEDKGYQGIS